MDVGLALRNSSKGQLTYDRFWYTEGRTKEIVDDVSRIEISIAPKLLSIIKAEAHYDENTNFEKNREGDSSRKDKLEHKKIMDSAFYELQSETELPLFEYELDRMKYIQDVFNSKKNHFDNFSLELQQHTDREYQLFRIRNEFDAKKSASDLLKIEEAMRLEAEEKELVQKEHYRNHVKKLSAKVHEAELKHKRAEEERLKNEQKQCELRQYLRNCQQEAMDLISKSTSKLNTCDHPTLLQVPLNERLSQMLSFMQLINDLVEQSKSRDLNYEDISTANLNVGKACELLMEISSDIELSKSKATQKHDKAAASFSFKDASEPRETTSVKETVVHSDVKQSTVTVKEKNEDMDMVDNATTNLKQIPETKSLISSFIAPDAAETFSQIIENLERVTKIIEPLESDQGSKQLRFKLQKQVMLPINTLSSNSGAQVKEKINQLVDLLDGRGLDVRESQKFGADIIRNYLANFIAKRFVEQSNSQIASQHCTAYPIAIAFIGLWSKKPEVGALFLGHLYKNCPYLVPYYPPRQQGQSDDDYHRILGYRFDQEGNREDRPDFLNRVAGYTRLYAALLISPLPPNSATPHPHPLSKGWAWFSSILNLDPRPDITATTIYHFLQVTGHQMQQKYGKQFNKVLHILCRDYFPRIKDITPEHSQSALSRLESFLQSTMRKGTIPPPEKSLDARFWNSTSNRDFL